MKIRSHEVTRYQPEFYSVTAPLDTWNEQNTFRNDGTRPGERLHFAMERSTIFHGKIHYFDWAMFHCYVTVHQRVLWFPRFPVPIFPDSNPFQRGLRDHRGQPEQWVLCSYQGSLLAWREGMCSHRDVTFSTIMCSLRRYRFELVKQLH